MPFNNTDMRLTWIMKSLLAIAEHLGVELESPTDVGKREANRMLLWARRHAALYDVDFEGRYKGKDLLFPDAQLEPATTGGDTYDDLHDYARDEIFAYHPAFRYAPNTTRPAINFQDCVVRWVGSGFDVAEVPERYICAQYANQGGVCCLTGEQLTVDNIAFHHTGKGVLLTAGKSPQSKLHAMKKHKHPGYAEIASKALSSVEFDRSL